MKISKSIILPEFESIESLEQAGDILESIESLEQAGDILHKITEAMKDHQVQNYDDAVASFRRVTTGRIQSQDGETYFDLDSGVIRGEIVFKPGSSGLDNVEEASPNDWDNAFRLANAVKGDDDFTLISGSKILTGSIAVGAFNSDVVARMFASETNKTNIEAWMKSGAITYIDGAKIYAGSITLTGLGTTIVSGGKIVTGLLTADNIRTGTLDAVRIRIGGGTDEDIYFKDSGIRFYDYHSVIGTSLMFAKAGLSNFGIVFGATQVELGTTGNTIILSAGVSVKIHADPKTFTFYDTAVLGFPNLASAPAVPQTYGTHAFRGDATLEHLSYYHNRLSEWRSLDSSAGW